MSACGSIHHIFENPLPENPTLLESLTWSQIKQLKSIDSSSSPTFTEIFGELHFKESPQPSPNSSSSPICTSSYSEINHSNFSQKGTFSYVSCDINQTPLSSSSPAKNSQKISASSEGFSTLNSESLKLCTEGLGFESSDDVEEWKNSGGGVNNNNNCERELVLGAGATKFVPLGSSELGDPSDYNNGEWRTRIRSISEYPPPISCIGRRTGKPRVSFKSYRKNGRFVLQEIRIPTQELLHAHREDGRLKLHFVQPDDEEEFLVEEDDYDFGYDYVEGVEEGEDSSVGKENDGGVTSDQIREEKEMPKPI